MRKVIQFLMLALFVGLLFSARWPPAKLEVLDGFLRIDPLLSIQAAIASRAWIPALGYGIAVLVLTLILGRFFCGYVCPMGTSIEYTDRLIYKKRPRKWKNRIRGPRWIKYVILAAILLAALFAQNIVYLFDPISWITRIFTYAVWPVAAVLGNLFLDIMRPVFEWTGRMDWARMELVQPVFGGLGVLSIVFFAFLIWLGRYHHRFWCRHLCPLGALLAIPARFSLFRRIVGNACDKDGKCSIICDTGAIGEEYDKYDPGECIVCLKCAPACHKKTTSFGLLPKTSQKAASFDLTKRRMLAGLSAGALISGYLAFNPARKVIGDKALRPPGAIEEDDFLATCIRCGQCVKVCPTSCLQPSTYEAGVAGFMSPIAVMRLGACDQNCAACGTVCPTGAIRSIMVSDKPKVKIGNAIIHKNRCVVWEQGLYCLVCDEHCTYGAIYWGENDEGKRVPYVDERICNGCGQCEHACPVEGVAAIEVKPNGQTRLTTGDYPEITAKPRVSNKPTGYGYP